tara:strand:+ start:2699 stop:3025 length:327 start_codon:yes stop_codon:yes gene_type:complete
MLATARVIVTAAVPLAAPEVAVMIAAPSAAAVTRPEDETVAFVDDELHDTLAPLIVAPFWSLTEALSWAVLPIASRLTLFGDTTTAVATGVGGVGGAVGVDPLSPPHP